MKRQAAIKVFVKAMEPDDLGVFIGHNICKEAMSCDRPGNLYLTDIENPLSVGLGIAMCSKKRVFIFCSDEYLMRNLSESAHIAVSKCDNVYLIVLVNGVYSDFSKCPTIYHSLMSSHGLLFNMGFLVHDYKRHFKFIKSPVKEINSIWKKIRGPLAIILDVECGSNKNLPAPEIESVNRTIAFLSKGE